MLTIPELTPKTIVMETPVLPEFSFALVVLVVGVRMRGGLNVGL
jgi:hypothetical protein